MQEPLSYDDLQEVFSGFGRADDLSEYHGALCGVLCVNKPEDIDLLRLIDADDESALPSDAKTRALLTTLRDATIEALQDEDLGFELLLPDDETALVPRVRALGAWCQGFLYGLASRPGLDLDKLSPEAREIVHDFSQFTQAAVGEDDDQNVEETAYAELVEYVRVGAQLLYMEMHPRPTLDPAESNHLH
ncbi:UPF0149 family protein [Solimonas marina]|uniref:UPF0149 family protein n=1 Tax=Solimonas marina TaxID=2714601 RepID=A0A970B9H8_9GAMM|nr:UPF0149 family protein [Solimonas marina]NKF22401.1 UPF0149 family protein [Solimonas marina]